MKIPLQAMRSAARDAFEIHCRTGVSEVLVPCNSGVPVTRQMLDDARIPEREIDDFWVFKVENKELYCVSIPEKYKETKA